MKNRTRHSGTFEIVRRERSSANGNPRYLCRCDGYYFYTAPDSALGYKVKNFDGKPATVVIGTYHGRLTLESIQ